MNSEDDYAYRFEYADGSAFQVNEDGRAFIVYKDGRREEKFGKIDNRIRLLKGSVAKPRQDQIDRLKQELEWMESDYLRRHKDACDYWMALTLILDLATKEETPAYKWGAAFALANAALHPPKTEAAE